ncbi:MAG: CopG family ribbon-helix-helix protein [Desulfurococcaceae archaeon]
MARGGSLRVGVYIPAELADSLEEIVRGEGLPSISRAVQEALRLYVAERSWRAGGEVVGAIGLVYDHEVAGADEALTDVQHRYLDVIASTVHVHLDERNCLLVIVVRGDAGRVRSLLGDVEGIRGVKAARLMILPRK